MASAQPFCDDPSFDQLLAAAYHRARLAEKAAKAAPPLRVVQTTATVCYSTADLVSELARLAEACGEPASIGLQLCVESGLRLRLWRDDGTGEYSVEIVEARNDDV